MTDFSTLTVHPTLQAALAMVASPVGAFNALTQEGLDGRMAYVKGLLASSQVVTILDPNFVDWASVELALSQDFMGGPPETRLKG